jgi:hypothetical protein
MDRKEFMRRFMVNRWWTFILAFCIGFAAMGGFPGPAIGDDNQGDPDMPGSPGYGSGGTDSGQRPKGSKSPVLRLAEGDGGRSVNVWMWRLQVVIKGLYFRF